MNDAPHRPDRRAFLQASAVTCGSLAWLTPLAHVLAGDTGTHRPSRREPARSLIVLWLAGGPSQLETFDPHPGHAIAGGTEAMETTATGIRIASGMPQTAEQLRHMTLVRNVVSQEGDHERASYLARTGYRPNPVLTHPAIGAVLCHQLPSGTAEVPRHIAMLSSAWPPRGGYLGNEYDAFVMGDPLQPMPDVAAPVEGDRFQRRLDDLRSMEGALQRRYAGRATADITRHLQQLEQATAMMSSDQLRAFEVEGRPERAAFGATPFGRACLAALQLIEVGVRCVEVSLPGWDSHVNNHDVQARLRGVLDPALGQLIRLLHERDLLSHTVVMCAGEFGRTPQLNPAGGRDHWPHGYSVALAGGPFQRGAVCGETDPRGSRIAFEQGTKIADLHATILQALGVPHDLEIQTTVGRPMKLSQGTPIPQLLRS